MVLNILPHPLLRPSLGGWCAERTGEGIPPAVPCGRAAGLYAPSWPPGKRIRAAGSTLEKSLISRGNVGPRLMKWFFFRQSNLYSSSERRGPIPAEQTVMGIPSRVPLHVRCSRLFTTKRASSHSFAVTSPRSGFPGRRTYRFTAPFFTADVVLKVILHHGTLRPGLQVGAIIQPPFLYLYNSLAGCGWTGFSTSGFKRLSTQSSHGFQASTQQKVHPWLSRHERRHEKCSLILRWQAEPIQSQIKGTSP